MAHIQKFFLTFRESFDKSCTTFIRYLMINLFTRLDCSRHQEHRHRSHFDLVCAEFYQSSLLTTILRVHQTLYYGSFMVRPTFLQAPKYLMMISRRGLFRNVDGVIIFVVLVYDKKFFLTCLEFEGLHFLCSQSNKNGEFQGSIKHARHKLG